MTDGGGDRLAVIEGNIHAQWAVILQLLRAWEGRAALTPVETDAMIEGVLMTLENRGPDDEVSRAARRAVERLAKQLRDRP